MRGLDFNGLYAGSRGKGTTEGARGPSCDTTNDSLILVQNFNTRNTEFQGTVEVVSFTTIGGCSITYYNNEKKPFSNSIRAKLIRFNRAKVIDTVWQRKTTSMLVKSLRVARIYLAGTGYKYYTESQDVWLRHQNLGNSFQIKLYRSLLLFEQRDITFLQIAQNVFNTPQDGGSFANHHVVIRS